MDLGLLDDPPIDIPIKCFLPPCLYFQTLYKAKAVPQHATKALGGEEVWLLLIDLGTIWG
jgi:hypothetical protein